MREADVRRILTHRMSRPTPPGATTPKEVLDERKQNLNEAVHWVVCTYPHRTYLDWFVTLAMCAALLAVIVMLAVVVHTVVGTSMPPLFHDAVNVLAGALYLWISANIFGDRHP